MASQEEGSSPLPDYEDTGSPQTPFLGPLGRPTFAASYHPTPANVVDSSSNQGLVEVQFDPELYISNEEMVHREEDFLSFMSCPPSDGFNDFNPVTDEPVAAQPPLFNDATVALKDQLIPDSAFDQPPDLYLPQMPESDPMPNPAEASTLGEGFGFGDLGQDWNEFVDFGDSPPDNTQHQQPQPELVQSQAYVAPSDTTLNHEDAYLLPLVNYMASENGQVSQSLSYPQPVAPVPPVSSGHDLPSLDFTYCPVVDDGFLEGYEHVDVDAEDAAAAAAAAAAAPRYDAGVGAGTNADAYWSPAAAAAAPSNEDEIANDSDSEDNQACSSATRRKRRWRKSEANRARERHNDKIRMRRRREQLARGNQTQDLLDQPTNRPVTRSIAMREQPNRIERPSDRRQGHVRFNVPSARIEEDYDDEDTITVLHQRPAAAIRPQPAPPVQYQPARNDYTSAPAANTFVPGTYRVLGDGQVIGYFREFSLEEARQHAGRMMMGGGLPAPALAPLALNASTPWSADPYYQVGVNQPVTSAPAQHANTFAPWPATPQYPARVNLPVTSAPTPSTSASASGIQPRRSGRVRKPYPRRD